MTDYRPIPCVDHERLEFAVLTRQWLEITVDAPPRPEVRRLLPRDVYTRDGAEWLRAETETGDTVTLRLDQLAF